MVSHKLSAQGVLITQDFSASMTVGALIRAARLRRGLTLGRVAELVGCAKSYLSAIENERRENPPNTELLKKLESILRIPEGRLMEIASWQLTPQRVQDELRRLQREQRDARRLATLISRRGLNKKSQLTRTLDEAYKTGELHRLVAKISGSTQSDADESQALPAALPTQVPVINKVQAGYPREFTDLGYPARVADEYVRCGELDDPDAFAARVVGDSMSPDYREGDIVVFSPARQVASGTDCFARLEPDHETTFKRVYFELAADGQQMIRLQPLNSSYAPCIVSRETVAGLYAAVSVTRPISHGSA